MCKNFHVCFISHAGKYLHRLIAFGNNNAQKYLRPKLLQYILNRTRKYNFLRKPQISGQNVSKWFEKLTIYIIILNNKKYGPHCEVLPKKSFSSARLSDESCVSFPTSGHISLEGECHFMDSSSVDSVTSGGRHYLNCFL